jgi:hypothetical protein
MSSTSDDECSLYSVDGLLDDDECSLHSVDKLDDEYALQAATRHTEDAAQQPGRTCHYPAYQASQQLVDIDDCTKEDDSDKDDAVFYQQLQEVDHSKTLEVGIEDDVSSRCSSVDGQESKQTRWTECGLAEEDPVDSSSDEEPLAQQNNKPPATCETSSESEAEPNANTALPNSATDDDDEDFQLKFDYQNPTAELTRMEMVSFGLHDIKTTHHEPRESAMEHRRLLCALLAPEEQPFDYRTSRKQLTKLTGIQEVRYDCCLNGCISYALPAYRELKECPYEECQHPRYQKNGKPYTQHSYIPITHRLKLLYANKDRAREMMDYRQRVQEEQEAGLRSDFWTGQLYRDLRTKQLFTDMTDIALALSTDGVKVFKTRSAFYIWPIMLVNFNLPPSVRFKRHNMLLVGFTPGPNNPKDLDSFLWPLVAEMKKLGQDGGVDAWNAATEKQFQLHAYITVVTADMPGREKLMNMKGMCICFAKIPHSPSVVEGLSY